MIFTLSSYFECPLTDFYTFGSNIDTFYDLKWRLKRSLYMILQKYNFSSNLTICFSTLFTFPFHFSMLSSSKSANALLPYIILSTS